MVGALAVHRHVHLGVAAVQIAAGPQVVQQGLHGGLQAPAPVGAALQDGRGVLVEGVDRLHLVPAVQLDGEGGVHPQVHHGVDLEELEIAPQPHAQGQHAQGQGRRRTEGPPAGQGLLPGHIVVDLQRLHRRVGHRLEIGLGQLLRRPAEGGFDLLFHRRTPSSVR